MPHSTPTESLPEPHPAEVRLSSGNASHGPKPTDAQLDELVVGILRGAQSAWPFGDDDSHANAFLDFAKAHRLTTLLHYTLKGSDVDLDDWPLLIREQFSSAAKAETAFQLLRDTYVQKFVTKCNAIGIEPVFFKGFALAHTVYSNACLRPSVDVDFLIRKTDRKTVVGVLESLGFETFAPYRGDLHSNEVVCRRETNGVSIEFDCHFEINNRPILARLISYEELRSAANLQQNGVLLPCNEHSLLLACMHRVAHNNTEDLLWLSDFAHIADAMNESQRERFVELCREKSASQICEASLRSAATNLGRNDLTDLADALREITTDNEPSAIYLREGRSTTGDAYVRWNSLGSTKQKLLYVGELLFPSRQFLTWKYGPTSRFRLLKNARDLFAMIVGHSSSNPSNPDISDAAKANRAGPNSPV